MIREISIRNFKSIQSLEMSLGRVNVLIGANGAGKSNILEALALGAAAADDKLDSEFLASRGIRIPSDPRLMRSAFDRENVDQDISLTLKTENDIAFNYSLHKDNTELYSPWINNPEKSATVRGSQEKITAALAQQFEQDILVAYREMLRSSDDPKLPAGITQSQVDDLIKNLTREQLQKQRTMVEQLVASMLETRSAEGNNGATSPQLFPLLYNNVDIHRFLIYSPEYSRLRVFDDEAQIQPLGIRGEGLFRLLKVLSLEPDRTKLTTIREKLSMFDWFDDMRVPEDLLPTERRLEIRDRYLDDTLAFFDQRSSSEGFLFVLFYLCLLLSRDTPRFFAIDNIDASLNPRLCTQLMIEFAALTAEHEKQVIVTTHNPAVLDGIDLNDDEQRLFVVSRNKNGLTRVRRVDKPKVSEGAKPVRLSEAFLRGYLGGLPNTF